MLDRTLRISDLIDDSPLSGLQVRVLLLCFLIVLLDGFDTAAIGYIAPELIQHWDISREQLAPAFGAGLVGMLIGSFCSGPLSDRHGRKKVLLGCILIFASGTLASPLASGIDQLAALRLLTGIGLGGVLPNCITLASEYSPKRRRMLLVTLSYSGFTLGLALGGSVAAALLPLLGWKGLLLLGGLAPVALLPILLATLPESVYYLARRPAQANKLRDILERIGGPRNWDGVILSGEEQALHGVSPASVLFSSERALRTLMLWLTFFCCLFVFYLLTNWLPTVLRASGYAAGESAHLSSMIPFGGVIGGILTALAMDRIGAWRVLPLLCLLAAVTLVATGQALQGGLPLMPVIFAAGFCLTGTLNNLSILAATLYPASARATGVSWAMTAGRAGSILGATIGGVLFTRAGDLGTFFAWLALPALVAFAALMLMAWRKPMADTPGQAAVLERRR